MTWSFAYPVVLPFLLVPGLLLIGVWRRKGRRISLPVDYSGLSSGRVWGFFLTFGESLPPILLAIVLLILAGPQRLGTPESKRKLTNIELLVDVSGSMTAPFGDGTRYDTSMKAIDGFLNFRKGDAIGLTFFGNTVLHWVPLTSDASAVRCAPPFMKPEVAPPWMGGTEIGRALRACKKILVERQEGDRMIILISDGDSFDLHSGADVEIASELKANNIVVYGIHISESEIPDPIVNITAMTGGEVFNPENADALTEVFRRIDRMQTAPMERRLAELKDDFFPYCIVGLSVLGLLAATLLFGWRYTPW